MNIAALGVTGHTGHYLAREITDRGHHCIGVARHATRYNDFQISNGKLTLRDASGSDYAQIKAVFTEEKVEKAICLYPPDVQHAWTFAADMRSLMNACRDAGVKELIMMMGRSAHHPRFERNPFDYASFGEQITQGDVYRQAPIAREETFEAEKDYHWVIFLVNHIIKYPERSGNYIYKVGGQQIWYDEHSQQLADAGVINYYDFACALVDEAENSNPAFCRQLVSLAWDKEYAKKITQQIPVMVNK